MSKKNNFSSAIADSLPDISSFKINEPIQESPVDNDQLKVEEVKEVEAKKDKVVVEKEHENVSPKKLEENSSTIEPKEGLELLKIKNTERKSHFTTTLSEEAQSNIKRMSLALDININDVVENCINAAYKSHEKEIQRLLRKKLL